MHKNYSEGLCNWRLANNKCIHNRKHSNKHMFVPAEEEEPLQEEEATRLDRQLVHSIRDLREYATLW